MNRLAQFSRVPLVSSDPEVLVDQESDLSSAKESGPLFGLFVPPD